MNKKAAVNRRRRGEVEQKSLRKFQRKVECASAPHLNIQVHGSFIKKNLEFCAWTILSPEAVILLVCPRDQDL